MKLLKIEYQDQEYNWRYEPIVFTSDLTLLVGISGAGKTQIIESILNLKKIANGASLNGVTWSIEFKAQDEIIYRWDGQFESQNMGILLSESHREEEGFNILTENLYKNGKKFVERRRENIIFNDQKMPKLSPTESIVALLKLEDDISVVQNEINKIYTTNDPKFNGLYGLHLTTFKKLENSDLSTIEASDIPILVKLFLVYQKYPQLFEQIKADFINIFNQVEDIKVTTLSADDLGNIPMYLVEILNFNHSPVVNIKEKEVNKWIKEPQISAGMLKVLMCLSQIYLSPKGSLILLDEIENSLGVNCLDRLIDNLLYNRPKDLQFIITSHHPYIINNISPQHWQIVTRKGGIVTVQNAEEWGISSSRQKAFIDLINLLEEYPQGIN